MLSKTQNPVINTLRLLLCITTKMSDSRGNGLTPRSRHPQIPDSKTQAQSAVRSIYLFESSHRPQSPTIRGSSFRCSVAHFFAVVISPAPASLSCCKRAAISQPSLWRQTTHQSQRKLWRPTPGQPNPTIKTKTLTHVRFERPRSPTATGTGLWLRIQRPINPTLTKPQRVVAVRCI